jgi:large subunit ribosomal protein L15
MRAYELVTSKKISARRKGRGISAGRGKTAGRGTKGQNSRSGGGVRPGFEGGQNPLIQRIPKLAGFSSRRIQTQSISLNDLERLKDKIITNEVLWRNNITEKLLVPVKIVASGKITLAKTVQLQSASKQAQVQILKAGGTFTAVDTPKKPKLSIKP